MRRIIYAVCVAAGLFAPLAVIAQAPPSVPALPDTERRTSYAFTNQISAAVNFALYGDSTDYQNWVEVYLNGVLAPYNSATSGWTITSPTGPVATIPRPITDGVFAFNQAQTGTVQIVGARRPRRTSQFSENRGVAARDLNQALTDIIAMLREDWDKINDVTGRGLFFAPGNTTGPMPLPSACANGFLQFDATGLNPLCSLVLSSGTLVTPAATTSGDLVVWAGTSGKQLADTGLNFASPPTIGSTTPSAGFFSKLGISGAITVPVRSALTSQDTLSATTDYFICANNSSTSATEFLPATPTTGITFLVKDCNGKAGTHTITISAGTIDGASTYAITTSYGSIAVTYTGATTNWATN